MIPEIVVLQHHPRTGPSAFVEVLDARASVAPWRLIDLDAGQRLPDVDALAGLISLGGPMGIVDEEPPTWLDAELDLLRAAVEAEVPVLGVCLGAQLLATALGGRVERRAVPEVGYVPLHRTEAASSEPVAAGWPDGTSALLFHQDEVAALPDGAEPVLTGSQQPAAWRLGSALGVQFHPETTVAQLEEWLAMEQLRAHVERGGLDPEQLLEEARRRERFTVAQGRALVGRFIDDPVRKHVQA